MLAPQSEFRPFLGPESFSQPQPHVAMRMQCPKQGLLCFIINTLLALQRVVDDLNVAILWPVCCDVRRGVLGMHVAALRPLPVAEQVLIG